MGQADQQGTQWPRLTAVAHSLSRIQFSATLWTEARQASLSFTISQSLLKFMIKEEQYLRVNLSLFFWTHALVQHLVLGGRS